MIVWINHNPQSFKPRKLSALYQSSPRQPVVLLQNPCSLSCGSANRAGAWRTDRKSTRLNSSHLGISYAVFCLKKKTNHDQTEMQRAGVVLVLYHCSYHSRL